MFHLGLEDGFKGQPCNSIFAGCHFCGQSWMAEVALASLCSAQRDV